MATAARIATGQWIVLFACLTLIACASQLPPAIKEAPANNLSLAEVRATPDKFIGALVRWGGIIAKVENKETETWVEIVDKDLSRWGQPRSNDQSSGRFLARIDGFLDPLVYAKGREITISGKVEQSIVNKIGDFTYLFPVIAVVQFYLWQPEPTVIYYDSWPNWFYDPWYPYYRYPYRHWHSPP